MLSALRVQFPSRGKRIRIRNVLRHPAWPGQLVNGLYEEILLEGRNEKKGKDGGEHRNAEGENSLVSYRAIPRRDASTELQESSNNLHNKSETFIPDPRACPTPTRPWRRGSDQPPVFVPRSVLVASAQ